MTKSFLPLSSNKFKCFKLNNYFFQLQNDQTFSYLNNSFIDAGPVHQPDGPVWLNLIDLLGRYEPDLVIRKSCGRDQEDIVRSGNGE